MLDAYHVILIEDGNNYPSNSYKKQQITYIPIFALQKCSVIEQQEFTCFCAELGIEH